ncbi:MAG: phosphate ABC transporter substrate-binding protein [Anaerolineae bacterium]
MSRKPCVATLNLFCLFILVGCAAASPSPAPTSPPIVGSITFAGSTTVQPLAAQIGQALNERYPELKLNIAAGGSTVGIAAIHDGTVDIGMASRKLKPDEAEGITVHQIAVDVLAVVVNAANPVENLTSAQLQDIYLGKITDWQAVGGADVPIVVVIRETNSGTRGAFDEIVLDKAEPASPGLQIAITAGDMAALVAKEPYAIGYVGFGNIEAGLKALSIDGISPTEENVRNGSYRLIRPLQLLTGPLTQPIAQTYVDFALSTEGQNIVVENGWVPVQ